MEKDISLLKFNLTAPELALNSPDKIYDKAIQPILDDAANYGWAYTVDKYGHFNIKTYLDQSGISPGAVRMIGVILNEEELFSTSMLESIRDSLTINDLTVFREFVGGTHKLLDPFLEELKDDIVLHSKVVAIKQDNGTVKNVDNTSPDRPPTPVVPTDTDLTDIKQYVNNFNGGNVGRILESLNSDKAGSIRPIKNDGGVNYLGDKIHSRPSRLYRPVAETIKQGNGKVHVEYVDNSSPDNPSKERKTVTGDYCIMTTTAKASLLMDYDPPSYSEQESCSL